MKNISNTFVGKILAVVLQVLLLSSTAWAEDAEPQGQSPIPESWYLSPLGTYTKPNSSEDHDDGYGGTLTVGYRKDFYAIEAGPVFSQLGARNGAADSEVIGGVLDAMIFPFRSATLYAIVGIGALEYSKYPPASERFSTATAEAGVGYLWPIKFGRYTFALRTEARYRYGRREQGEGTNVDREDDDAPNTFKDTIVNVGLYLPMQLNPPSEPEPEKAKVVPLLDE